MLAIECENSLGACRHVDEHELCVGAVLIEVLSRYHADDGFAIGRDLRIGDSHDFS